MFIRRGFAVSAAVATAIAAFSPSLHADSHSIAEFAIPAQPLSTALIDLSKQANIQILTAGSAVDGVLAPAVSGRLTLEAALHRLLKDSEFEYRFVDKNTLVLSPKKAQAAATLRRVAQVSDAGAYTGGDDSGRQVPGASPPPSARVSLEEIVVTGSHIRGVENASSPITRFSREEIEERGYTTTQQFIQSLTQNLNSFSENTFGVIAGGEGSMVGGGFGPNLRGLGGSSTLVLLNGRRLAPAGVGNYVDISLIPLSAIERVDVMTDGASALYGSDAIGGVINFILRKDLDGAETLLSYGAVTQGDHSELKAGQTFGHSWQGGRALLTYEYARRNALDTEDREFTPMGPMMPELELIPGQRRHGVYADLSQSLTEDVDLESSLFYGERTSTRLYGSPAVPQRVEAEVEQLGASVGIRADLSGTWQMRATVQGDQSTTAEKLTQLGIPTPSRLNDASVVSGEVILDGAAMALAGGDMRLALGGTVRTEEFTEKNVGVGAGSLERDVYAAFGELVVPLFGENNRRQGFERLEVSLAGRYEDYSDFRDTFNRKLGIAWSPLSGVNVRGTLGTSFKAPLLSDLNPAAVRPSAYYAGADLGLNAIYIFGSGADLQPEEATTWTAGLDLNPVQWPGLTASLTYFDIDYENRIGSPLLTSHLGYEVAAVDPLYASYVTFDPSADMINAWLSHPAFTNNFGLPLDQIKLIADGRMTNFASMRQRGLDFSASYRMPAANGQWTISASGTHLIENEEQLVEGSPQLDLLNIVYKPVDLKLRGSIAFTRGALSVATHIVHTDSYRDTRATVTRVGSWTTFDLNIQFDLAGPGWSKWLGHPSATLSVINAFDRDPPFIASMFGINFDGVNASPLGRFVTLQVRTRW